MSGEVGSQAGFGVVSHAQSGLADLPHCGTRRWTSQLAGFPSLAARNGGIKLIVCRPPRYTEPQPFGVPLDVASRHGILNPTWDFQIAQGQIQFA